MTRESSSAHDEDAPDATPTGPGATEEPPSPSDAAALSVSFERVPDRWAPEPWHGTGDQVIYPPEVPYDERVELPFRKRARVRVMERFGDRIMFKHEAMIYLKGNKTAYDAVEAKCWAVWNSAHSLNGLLDLDEVSHRLDREHWTCLQLARQVRELRLLPYTTEAAEKVLSDQFDERLAELDAWAQENGRLYAEHGADPASLPEAVGRALAVADALLDDRPARDTAELVGELRHLLNTRTELER